MYSSPTKERMPRTNSKLSKLSKQNCVSPGLPLLPDEYSLAEGRTDFEISCDRIGYLHGSPENVFARLKAQVYITHNRVSRRTSFQLICS
jgi:hypothetical protein